MIFVLFLLLLILKEFFIFVIYVNYRVFVCVIQIQRDRGFKIVPEVVPYAWMLATNTDCRNKQLPSYAGNLVFVLPVKNETPITYTIRITLYQKATEYEGEFNTIRH